MFKIIPIFHIIGYYYICIVILTTTDGLSKRNLDWLPLPTIQLSKLTPALGYLSCRESNHILWVKITFQFLQCSCKKITIFAPDDALSHTNGNGCINYSSILTKGFQVSATLFNFATANHPSTILPIFCRNKLHYTHYPLSTTLCYTLHPTTLVFPSIGKHQPLYLDLLLCDLLRCEIRNTTLS